jgi:hypothetical protein
VRVADLYEVLGQAARSVRWMDTQLLADRLLSRLRSGSKLLYGEEAELIRLLDEWTKSPVPGRFSIYVVQPGLRLASINQTAVRPAEVDDFSSQRSGVRFP